MPLEPVVKVPVWVPAADKVRDPLVTFTVPLLLKGTEITAAVVPAVLLTVPVLVKELVPLVLFIV